MSAYSTAVLADSPNAYLRLGDSSGTSAADASGNSHPGTYVNAPTLGATSLLSQDSDTAVTFASASSQYVDTVDSSGFQVANLSTGFSIELWCKFTGTAQGVIYSEGSVTAGQLGVWLNTNVTAGKLTFFVRGNTDGTANVNATGTTSINDGNPHHIVATMTSAGVYVVYVDTNVELSGTATSMTGLTPTRGGIAVLNRAAGLSNNFNGTIDEVAVYKSVLSSTRVSAHYSAATTPSAASDTAQNSGSAAPFILLGATV